MWIKVFILILFSVTVSAQTYKGRKEIGESFRFTKDSLYWKTNVGTVGCKYTIKKDSIIVYSKYATFRFSYSTKRIGNILLQNF